MRRGQITQSCATGNSSRHGEPEWSHAVEHLVDSDHGHELVLAAAEEAERLLELLPDKGLQRIAVDKLHGHTNRELGARVGRSLATVERRLRLIRVTWEGHGVDSTRRRLMGRPLVSR